MKNRIFSLILLVLLLAAMPLEAFADALYTPEDPAAEIIYMISLDTDAVIVDLNSDQKVAPASITKLVTAMVTLENCDDYDAVVEASSYAIRSLDGTNSSTAGIKVGEELTVRQLLYCLMVASANDAANVLAEYVAGDIDKFVVMMNDFVALLGCENTHFLNPHGLDAQGHYTTAKDLAVIYRYCLQNALFTEIAGTFETEIPATNKTDYARHLINTNNLLNDRIPDYYSPYVKNGKTGTTDDAGRCVISSASKDGYNYLLVVLKAGFYDYDDDGYDENMAFVESQKLYKWAYDNLRLREVANPSLNVTEAKVTLGKKYDYVSLVPAEPITALVPIGVNAESVLPEPIPEVTKFEVQAPVRKGDVLGRATIRYAGQTIAEVDLVAAFDVERSTPKFVWHQIKTFFSSKFMKILLVFVLVVLLPFFLVVFVILPRRRRARRNASRVSDGRDRRYQR